MNPISWLLGKWEVTQQATATVAYTSPLLRRSWNEQVGITIERHTRTNEERAFIHGLDGSKTKTSLAVVKAAIHGVGK